MRVGLVGRADNRGLGVQSWEFYRALQPHAVLCVDEPGSRRLGFTPDFGRYPGCRISPLDTDDWTLPLDDIRWLVEQVDVIYAAETLYDWRIVAEARERCVATVVHLNPEFYKHPGSGLPHPTVWWNPTTWRMDDMPRGCRHVPVPVAVDRFTPNQPADGPLRVLHVAGHQAAADRNGTRIVADAIRLLRQPAHVRVICQDQRLQFRCRPPKHVTVDVVTGGVANYWDLYHDCDLLVLPRRYGGLCLPAQEAQAAGVVVVMPDVEPQRTVWPTVRRVPAQVRGRFHTHSGVLRLAETDPAHIARAIDRYAKNRVLLAQHSHEALEWAQSASWGALAPMYRDELWRAVETETEECAA